MTTMDPLAISEGLVSQLEEQNELLQVSALTQLSVSVDKCWHIIADHIVLIEKLWENESFPERELAAFVASKVYYHLEEIGDSLEYALNAGDRFDIEDSESEYVQTLISQCIDDYIRIRTDPDSGDKIDPRLEKIVEQMLRRCFEEGQTRQALGIAVEAHRIDFVKEAIEREGMSDDVLSYTFDVCETVVGHKGFRTQLFELLLTLYRQVIDNTGSVDYRNICKCLYFLDNPTDVGSILLELLQTDRLMAYQTAFDLAEYEDDHFLGRVSDTVIPPPEPVEEAPAVEAQDAAPAEPAGDGTAVLAPAGDGTNPPAAQPVVPKAPEIDPEDPRAKLVSILSGSFGEKIWLQILFNENHSDFVILKNIKDSIPPQIGCLNMAVAAANGIMHCNTTIDQFLRDNLKWLSKSFRNFDKFLSVAFMGMIHKGHASDGKKVLEAYLPPAEGPIAGGGALYGLGLIHAMTCTEEIRDYLFKQLMDSESNEILRHGAMLGNALVSIGSQNLKVYSELAKIFETGSAIPGSGAGFSIGLIMAGSMNEMAIEALLEYCTTSTHQKSEKVIRGGVIALALICFAQEENADELILRMRSDRDFHLRYGACYAIGMAYACTGNTRALRMLLDLAVSDVSDDVRRAATTAIGFVFANKPDEVPDLLRLLAKSYNPFVRYGAACAISIACAGTANKQAWKLLEILSKDNVEYVRQGAHIATGMLFSQRNETECPEIKTIRETFDTIITSKRRTAKMARMGAVLGSGFLDAGGRNLTICMMTSSGQKRMKAIVGMCLFWQHWDWYPLIPMVSLCFKPTMTVGLNENLELPEQTFVCDCKPSMFKYPEPLKEETKKKKKLLKKAVLSTSAKANARKAQKAKEVAQNNGEDVEMEDVSKKSPEEEKEKMDIDGEEEEEEGEEKEKKKPEEPEPESYTLSNPCRITRSQQKHISLEPDSRYELVNERVLTGFVCLRDKNPEAQVQLVELRMANDTDIYGDEPDPPADFYYTGN